MLILNINGNIITDAILVEIIGDKVRWQRKYSDRLYETSTDNIVSINCMPYKK